MAEKDNSKQRQVSITGKYQAEISLAGLTHRIYSYHVKILQPDADQPCSYDRELHICQQCEDNPEADVPDNIEVTVENETDAVEEAIPAVVPADESEETQQVKVAGIEIAVANEIDPIEAAIAVVVPTEDPKKYSKTGKLTANQSQQRQSPSPPRCPRLPPLKSCQMNLRRQPNRLEKNLTRQAVCHYPSNSSWAS